MKAGQFRTGDYLQHIAEACARIERYTENVDELGFLANPLIQDGVLRNIQIVGEAANNICKSDPQFAADHAEVPWSVMYAMRNRVTHGYHQIDLDIVWNLVRNDVPQLQEAIRALIAQLPQP